VSTLTWITTVKSVALGGLVGGSKGRSCIVNKYSRDSREEGCWSVCEEVDPKEEPGPKQHQLRHQQHRLDHMHSLLNLIFSNYTFCKWCYSIVLSIKCFLFYISLDIFKVWSRIEKIFIYSNTCTWMNSRAYTKLNKKHCYILAAILMFLNLRSGWSVKLEE